ncbi:MAG: hypothetical protein IGBAC_1392 [Ignavibacteriae bacterium]|nr:MAG: hypothetical protein IGBAC_1392 [Ignavibacteriota bacterium]
MNLYLTEMKWSLIILTFFIFGCKSTLIENGKFSLGQEFEIKFGEEKTLSTGELSVKFDSLLTDSRCAIGVVCVWEGEAQIRLKLNFNDIGTQEYHYLKIKGYVNKENTAQHQSIVAKYFLITLMQLDPYPVHNVPRDQEKYKALLKIEIIERK